MFAEKVSVTITNIIVAVMLTISSWYVSPSNINIEPLTVQPGVWTRYLLELSLQGTSRPPQTGLHSILCYPMKGRRCTPGKRLYIEQKLSNSIACDNCNSRDMGGV